MKLFGMPVRVIKKGKTRGRPSKMEKTASKLLSYYMQQPEFQEAMKKAQMDMALYGAAIIPTKYLALTKKRRVV